MDWCAQNTNQPGWSPRCPRGRFLQINSTPEFSFRGYVGDLSPRNSPFFSWLEGGYPGGIFPSTLPFLAFLPKFPIVKNPLPKEIHKGSQNCKPHLGGDFCQSRTLHRGVSCRNGFAFLDTFFHPKMTFKKRTFAKVPFDAENCKGGGYLLHTTF